MLENENFDYNDKLTKSFNNISKENISKLVYSIARKSVGSDKFNKLNRMYKYIVIKFSVYSVKSSLEYILSRYRSLEEFEYIKRNILERDPIPFDEVYRTYIKIISDNLESSEVARGVLNLSKSEIVEFYNKMDFLKDYDKVLELKNSLGTQTFKVSENELKQLTYIVMTAYLELKNEFNSLSLELNSARIKDVVLCLYGIMQVLYDGKEMPDYEIMDRYIKCLIIYFNDKLKNENKLENKNTKRSGNLNKKFIKTSYREFELHIQDALIQLVNEHISTIQDLIHCLVKRYFFDVAYIDTQEFKEFLFVLLMEYGNKNWHFRDMYNELEKDKYDLDLLKSKLYAVIEKTDVSDIVDFSFMISESFAKSYGMDNYINNRIGNISRIYSGKMYSGKIKIKTEEDIKDLILYSFMFAYGKYYPNLNTDNTGILFENFEIYSCNSRNINLKNFLNLSEISIKDSCFVSLDVGEEPLYFMKVKEGRVYIFYWSRLFNTYLEILFFDLCGDNLRDVIFISDELSGYDITNINPMDIFSRLNVKINRESVLQFIEAFIDTINNFGKGLCYELSDEGSEIQKYMFSDLSKFKIFTKNKVDINKYVAHMCRCFRGIIALNMTDLYFLAQSYYGKEFLLEFILHTYKKVTASLVSKELLDMHINEPKYEVIVADSNDNIPDIKYCSIIDGKYSNKLNNILSRERKLEKPNEDKFDGASILLVRDDNKKIFSYLIILIKLGYMGSNYVIMDDSLANDEVVSKLEELSTSLDEEFSSEELSSEDFEFLKGVLEKISFNFSSIFRNIKLCNYEVKELDLNKYCGFFFEKLGDSLTIYNFSCINGDVSIKDVFYLDYVTDYKFKFTEYGLLEENVYSMLSDDLARCGEFGIKMANKTLEEVSKLLFTYVFYNILILERSRIQEFAENIKNRKVNVNVFLDKEEENSFNEEDELNKGSYNDLIGSKHGKNLNKNSNSSRRQSTQEKVTIRKNKLTEEDLKVIESIDTSIISNMFSEQEVVGVKVISLNNLFMKNVSRIFKGNRSLERAKPNYTVKSWEVRGYTRVSKNGVVSYIEPRKAYRNKELLGNETVEYQQKIIKEDSLLKEVDKLQKTDLFK